MQTLKSRKRESGITGMIRSQDRVVEVLRDVMDELQDNYIVEGRLDRRFPLCVPIEITPFNLAGERTGQAFTAVSKDISAGGMAFLYTSAIMDRILAVSFPSSDRHGDDHFVIRVSRRRSVGPLWEIAGSFVTDAN